MHPRKNHNLLKAGLRLSALAAFLLTLPSADAVSVVVLLRNGDRITGELIAQETNRVVIVTSWAGTLALPLDTIGGLQTSSGDKLTLEATTPSPVPKAAATITAATTAKPKPVTTAAPPKRLRTNLQVGANLMFGARDYQAFFGRVKSTYERPYDHNPKKFFRTITDYTADYGETENVRSANRMTGSVKTDFDLGQRSYCYNVGSGGYDEIRKVDLHYEVGPGLGYHLIKRPTFEFNVESGLNYQVQQRSAGQRLESVYLRAGEDTTWKFGPRLSLIKKFEFFVNGDNWEEFRFRLDSTVSYKLIENLSLNLTLLDMFDTDPAPKVDRNELQIRSSIGITF